MVRLKDAFVEKTGGAIEVFLSSDGQSIPLGANWVYKVQEGLEAAAIMIVFITPNSLGSGWIYFEAGYSYSKKVSVVPVGFLGLDLTKLGPPLSLLQGFNITSADTLNNLIALANDHFKHKHKPCFTPDDYTKVVGSNGNTTTSALDPVIEILGDVELNLNQSDNGLMHPADKLFPVIRTLLGDLGVEHSDQKTSINIRGVQIHHNYGDLRFEMAPTKFETVLPTINAIIAKIRKPGKHSMKFRFSLINEMRAVQHSHKISALLFDDGISITKDGGVSFRGLNFETGHNYYSSGNEIRITNSYVDVLTEDTLPFDDAAELLNLLYSRGVLYFPKR